MDRKIDWVSVLMLLALAGLLAATFWPRPAGWEISSWLGKFTVRPAPAPPVLVPPATRCLIFSASWCGPCRELKRTVGAMQRNGWRVGPLPTDDIEFIDVDGPDERIKQYRYTSIPTLIIVDQSGRELSRRVGVQNAAALAEWIRQSRK